MTAHQVKDNAAVLVCSHDEYADVWPDFFSLWFRFWPDTPFPIYLVSNERVYPDPRVRTLPVGKGLTWSQRMRRALDQITTPYILFSTEDFFFYERVDTAQVLGLFEQMQAERAAYLRLMPGWIPYTPLSSRPDLGVVEKGVPYRGAGQLSFWRHEVMLDTLSPDESAAEWERQTTVRTDHVGAQFLAVRDGVEPVKYHNMIRAGKWNREAIRDYASRGIDLKLSKRPVQNRFDLWWQTPSASRRALSTCKHLALRAVGRR